jgi:hypothetical protein
MTTADPADDFTRATEDLEAVPLVPDQGEDEGDAQDGSITFSASVGAKDWTVETLVLQMRKGRIDLSPSFQRRNAWLSNRKSKLIESIMLGFPIPQIVLAEKLEKPGYFFVLDGKQRLLALRQFFFTTDDPRDEGFDALRLTGLEVKPELNRKDARAVEEASPDIFAQIENHSIRTVVLSNWNSERLLLSLFLRLNTGSVPLSPQELRQALIPGHFMAWLDAESGQQAELRELLGNTHPDRRMIDAELALRHIAFSRSPIKYRGNLKQFLDDTSRQMNADWAYQKALAADDLEQMGLAIRAGFELFGRDKFCRKWSATKYERALNRAVFDFQVYSLSKGPIRVALAGKGEELQTAFQEACDTNEDFARSITTTTKTSEAFITRHRVWRSIVEKVGMVKYDLPDSLVRE